MENRARSPSLHNLRSSLFVLFVSSWFNFLEVYRPNHCVQSASATSLLCCLSESSRPDNNKTD